MRPVLGWTDVVMRPRRWLSSRWYRQDETRRHCGLYAVTTPMTSGAHRRVSKLDCSKRSTLYDTRRDTNGTRFARAVRQVSRQRLGPKVWDALTSVTGDVLAARNPIRALRLRDASQHNYWCTAYEAWPRLGMTPFGCREARMCDVWCQVRTWTPGAGLTAWFRSHDNGGALQLHVIVLS